jgi:pimeloyl-ACP methyl ester carboxylesterase
MTSDLVSPAGQSSSSKARTGRTLTLKDGRALGYGEWGDPIGKPFFYFHGYPGSRYEAVLADEAASKIGIRLIALDRPGMGLSTPKPGRQILDWPSDVLEAADALRINRFAVVGMSGGGPYAAACAYKIPDRLTTCSIVAGLAPLEYGAKDMTFQIQLVFWAARHVPWLYELVLKMLINRYRQNPEKMEKMLLDRVYRSPEPDRVHLAKPEIRAAIMRYTEEAFRQGTDGAVHEGRLYTRPWGFEPQDIVFKRIALWHGDLDRSVPVSMGRAMAKRIPNVRATFYPNDAHLSIGLNHMEEILDWGSGLGD